MTKLGIYLDLPNLYYSLYKKYGRSQNGKVKKLDFNKTLTYLEDFGTIVRKNAYLRDYSPTFINMLHSIGFVTKMTYVDMIIDLIKCEDVDMCIIGSNNVELMPVIRFLREEKIKVMVLAANIPIEMREVTTAIDIPPSLIYQEAHANGMPQM